VVWEPQGVTGHSENLIDAMARATDNDKAMGLKAYPNYHLTLRAFSELYGVGIVPTVEAFAALSPNNDYHGNLRSLASVLFAVATGRGLDTVVVSTYNACAARAFSYATGAVSFLDTVAGRKTTSFRHNLLYPQTSKLVTVDGHMLGVWAGKHLTMKEAVPYMKPGVYDQIERVVQRLARQHKIPVPAVQATLWMQRKRERGVVFSEQVELFSGLSRWDEVCSTGDYPPFGPDVESWREWYWARKAAKP
jgi:hypothetical protein